MTTAITTLLLLALLISCVKVATMMVKDREWALGSVLLLAMVAGALAAIQEVWS